MVDAVTTHEQALRDKNSTPVLLVLDRANNKIYQADAEPDHGIQRVQLMVWDPDGLTPVRMVQPTINVGDLDVTIGDVEALLANRYFKRTIPYTYSSGRIKYMCKNYDIDASYVDPDWLVWKYSDDGIPYTEGPRIATNGVASSGAIDALGTWNI